MIIPLVAEEEWIAALSELPLWEPSSCPTVILSPHPDDETLGVGGLLSALSSRGVDVRVIAVTDGENAYDGDRGLGPIRQREQEHALEEIGVCAEKITRLRLEDSGLNKFEEDLIRQLSACIEPGTHLIAPWPGDFHPDHEVCGRAAQSVAASLGLQLTFYFFWTWHRGTPATLDGLPLVAFPLTAEQVTRKGRALAHHGSQLTHASGQPILPSYLLEPMKRQFEVYLPA